MRKVGTFMGLPLYLNELAPQEGFAVVSLVDAKGSSPAHYHVVGWGPGGLHEQKFVVDEVMALSKIKPKKDGE